MEISVYPHIDEPGETVHIEFDQRDPDKIQDSLQHLNEPLIEWVDHKTNIYGHRIIPKHIFTRYEDDDGHMIVWVDHKFTSTLDHEPKEMHHIVCECVRYQDSQSAQEAVFTCRAVHKTIDLRTKTLTKEYGLSKSKDYYLRFDEETLDFTHTTSVKNLAIYGIARVLNSGVIKPHYWLANKIEGIHDTSQLAQLLEIDESIVVDVIRKMHINGLVEFNGKTVSLAPKEYNKVKSVRTCDKDGNPTGENMLDSLE